MSESDQNTARSISNENAKRILSLLKKGDEKINLDTHHDVVLVLGNTGSGKTTFTQFIAGNNDELFSIEVDEGLNEFIISDTNNKINFNTTVISKTLFPELLVDNETKTAYVDCPGFNGHNEAYDIATSYFIKKVLDKAQNIKIVLIVSYPSLRRGGNGHDILQLLEQITILVKNIDKYVDSVALVATKVDNTYVTRQGVSVMISDNTVIEQVAKFLKEVKNSMKIMKDDDSNSSDFKRVEHNMFYENAKKLLEALLSKKDTEYTKIGIFRRPNQAGKISHVQLLQNGKKTLKHMIDQNLKYLPIEKSDIGYSVSDKSKTAIRDLINEINGNVISDFASIAQSVIKYYEELEGKMFNDDMYTLRDQLEQASTGIKKITSIDKLASIDELVNSMCENFTQMAVKVAKSNIRDIKNLSNFLDFLQEISGHKSESIVSKCVKELECAVNAVDNSFMWYNFLGTLHKRLSEYDVQKNTTIFHVPKLEAKNTVFRIGTLNDFPTFIDEIADASHLLKELIYENIKDIYLDATKIQYFDQLINVTLKNPITITCMHDSKRLQVVGEYIKLSQITENECYPSSTSVQIFAKHSIFIDTDLSTKNDISIISPNWHIIGSRKIILDGTNGQPHSVPKANDGFCEGCNGKDGLPGHPGSSGGHFFGIGSTFENSEKLTISANGGTGGTGQHGGDGKIGARGNDASKMDEITYTADEEVLMTCKINMSCFSIIDYYASTLANGYVKYTVDGNPGGRGGNAGHGGAGGAGGEAGTVTLIGSNHVSSSVLNGTPGPFGLHGNCGGGGEGGRDISITYTNTNFWDSSRKWQLRDQKANNGDSGTCLYVSNVENANHQGLQKPKKKEFYSHSQSISDFMIRMIKNSDNCINKKVSRQFYAELRNNEKLKNFYNLEFVTYSIQELRKYFNQFTLNTSATFYQFLLSKVVEDVKTVSSTKQIETSIHLEMLQVLLSSKLIMLKNRKENRLLLNHNQYFDMLVNADFDEIQNYYRNTTTRKIADTIKFIETSIITEINDAIGRIDFEIAKLSQNDVDDELDSLLSKRKVFACLEFLKDFLSLALSFANVDLMVTNQTKISKLSPSLITFQVEEILTNNEGFRNIEKDVNEFELETNRKIDAMIWVVSNEIAALQAMGDEYDESCKLLRSIENELHFFMLIKEKTITVDDLIRKELLRFDEVNLRLIKLGPRNISLDKIIQRCQNHMKLIQFNSKMYQNIIRWEYNVERLTNAIDRANDNASHDLLNKSKEAFFDVVTPILEIIRTGFTKTGYKPNDTEKIRQLVQQGLEQVKLIADRTTEKLEMDEDLQTLCETMDEAFTTLIGIYENLYSHEDRTRLNVLLHYAEDHFTVGHNETGKILPSFKNDHIQYEYEQSIDVFKQYVFPLDTLYPFNLTIRSMPNLDQNFDNLKSAIATNVKFLKTNLDAMQQSGEYLLQDYFNNTSGLGAFFVWKSEGYGNSIKRFLRGKEIALKAITNENDRHEMMKFDSINLAFHSSNDTIQKLLNDNLINFSLRMTHSGTSYFRFCRQTRTTYSESLSLSYNLNETSIHIEPMLSPYTTWIMKLDPINGNVSFIDLEPFQEQKIHLLLEGHARYINAPNQSTCEKFLTGPMTTNYTSLITNNIKTITPNQGTSNSTRKRRDVSSQWSGFVSSFKDNFSFLKSINPFNFFVGTNSQNAQSSIPQSLEWGGNSSTSSNVTQLSSDLNSTLVFLDYLVRDVTKVKPYQATTTLNLDQVRVVALEVIDRFEAMLLKLRDELDIPPSQLELDPVKLMSELEGEIINGDPSAIIKTLQNSVTVDPQFENRFNTKLVLMLNQINDRSNQHSQDFQYKDREQLQNHYVEHAFIDHVNEAIPSHIENNNTFLQN